MINPAVVPSDADIRSALRSTLVDQHASNPDTVIIDEHGLCRGKARVDVMVVNNVLHGYEIKSDRDSLRRLGNQIDFYGKVLDRATLVVGKRNLRKALQMVPAWWSIIIVHTHAQNVRFTVVRNGQENPRRDPRSLVELLWLDAAIALLEERGAARGVRGKPRRVVWDRICQQCSEDEISETVRNHLKAKVARQAL